jgi:H+/gluconate symporter-like permease
MSSRANQFARRCWDALVTLYAAAILAAHALVPPHPKHLAYHAQRSR